MLPSWTHQQSITCWDCYSIAIEHVHCTETSASFNFTCNIINVIHGLFAQLSLFPPCLLSDSNLTVFCSAHSVYIFHLALYVLQGLPFFGVCLWRTVWHSGEGLEMLIERCRGLCFWRWPKQADQRGGWQANHCRLNQMSGRVTLESHDHHGTNRPSISVKETCLSCAYPPWSDPAQNISNLYDTISFPGVVYSDLNISPHPWHFLYSCIFNTYPISL